MALFFWSEPKIDRNILKNTDGTVQDEPNLLTKPFISLKVDGNPNGNQKITRRRITSTMEINQTYGDCILMTRFVCDCESHVRATFGTLCVRNFIGQIM